MCVVCMAIQPLAPRPGNVDAVNRPSVRPYIMSGGVNQRNPDGYIRHLTKEEGPFLRSNDAIEDAFVSL